MLHKLKIENFTLIESLQLELSPGLNVLTGETGAGKSIILDAIDAVLGGKAPGRMIRTGHQQATIEAEFVLSEELRTELQARNLVGVQGQALVCSREIHTTSSRSRSRFNGSTLTKKQMEDLRDRLVEITAQGQTVQLGQPSLQRDWLDSFGGQAVLQQRERVSAAYSAAQTLSQRLEQRRQAENDRLQQLDLFQYQLKELAAAQLEDPQELDLLLQEQQRLSHAVELQHQSYGVYQALYQDDRGGVACADLLGRAEQTLQEMCTYDPDVQPILEMVSAALSQVEEAGRQINTYGENMETDPDRLGEVEIRIAELKQICRKYGPTLAEAIAHADRIQEDLDLMTGGGQSLAELEAAYAQAQAELRQHCQTLTELRQRTSTTLEHQLIAELKPLAMEKVQFQVQLKPMEPSATGADQILFRFSPNPGEPLQPLGEIASGGEMSRFLLALKACFSQIDRVSTLIFDEIDVGVSGRVSQAIAQKLQELSQQHQVLCVTHQPLIAALADRHFKVSKTVSDNRTRVQVTLLDDRGSRRQELAELAGGESAVDALDFADSLLNQTKFAAEVEVNFPTKPETKVETKLEADPSPENDRSNPLPTPLPESPPEQSANGKPKRSKASPKTANHRSKSSPKSSQESALDKPPPTVDKAEKLQEKPKSRRSRDTL